MAKCDHCSNEYDKAFRITQNGRTMTFDSFECAIHALAPTCAHCDCHIVGHGVEQDGAVYCCAHCAHQAGAMEVKDRYDGNGRMHADALVAEASAESFPASDPPA